MANTYVGVEEVMNATESLGLGEIKSAFLFLIKSTKQLFAQMSEEDESPTMYKDDDILYCGQLRSYFSAEDILQYAEIAEKNSEVSEEELAYLESLE